MSVLLVLLSNVQCVISCCAIYCAAVCILCWQVSYSSRCKINPLTRLDKVGYEVGTRMMELLSYREKQVRVCTPCGVCCLNGVKPLWVACGLQGESCSEAPAVIPGEAGGRRA